MIGPHIKLDRIQLIRSCLLFVTFLSASVLLYTSLHSTQTSFSCGIHLLQAADVTDPDAPLKEEDIAHVVNLCVQTRQATVVSVLHGLPLMAVLHRACVLPGPKVVWCLCICHMELKSM